MRRGGLRQIQGRVLAEDRQLKLPELRARLNRQLLGKQRAPGAVGFQRLGLAAGPVQREHQLPAEPLAQGMLGNQLLKLGTEGAVSAERQLRLDPVLHRGQAARLEPLHLEPGKRFELKIGQRPAAPQRLRVAQQHRGPARITVLQRVTALGHPLVECVQVQLALFDAEQVPGRAGEQPRLGRHRWRAPCAAGRSAHAAPVRPNRPADR